MVTVHRHALVTHSCVHGLCAVSTFGYFDTCCSEFLKESWIKGITPILSLRILRLSGVRTLLMWGRFRPELQKSHSFIHNVLVKLVEQKKTGEREAWEGSGLLKNFRISGSVCPVDCLAALKRVGLWMGSLVGLDSSGGTGILDLRDEGLLYCTGGKFQYWKGQ